MGTLKYEMCLSPVKIARDKGGALVDDVRNNGVFDDSANELANTTEINDLMAVSPRQAGAPHPSR